MPQTTFKRELRKHTIKTKEKRKMFAPFTGQRLERRAYVGIRHRRRKTHLFS